MTSPATGGLRCRRIAEADFPAVAELFSRGFRFRREQYWLRGLHRLAKRPRPTGDFNCGYLLEQNGKIVGAILLIYATVCSGTVCRCNLSSWYVEPKFRSYGSLLISSAIKEKSTTYFNVSPAPNTWQIVEAQGFSIYCRGEMYVLPSLNKPLDNVKIEIVAPGSAMAGLPDGDLLAQHATFGCLSLVLRHDGENYPFVFQRYHVKRVLPTYRLIYCHDVADFGRFGGNLGRLLLKRGMPLVAVDANARIPELVGWYTERRGRKYARGPHVPRLGDLAFSEGVFFDV